MSSSYEDLEVYQLALRLAVDVHRMSLDELPRHEMYEEGSQVRRSSKSVVAESRGGLRSPKLPRGVRQVLDVCPGLLR